MRRAFLQSSLAHCNVPMSALGIHMGTSHTYCMLQLRLLKIGVVCMGQRQLQCQGQPRACGRAALLALAEEDEIQKQVKMNDDGLSVSGGTAVTVPGRTLRGRRRRRPAARR